LGAMITYMSLRAPGRAELARSHRRKRRHGMVDT
jgi:hypothetical protein